MAYKLYAPPPLSDLSAACFSVSHLITIVVVVLVVGVLSLLFVLAAVSIVRHDEER